MKKTNVNKILNEYDNITTDKHMTLLIFLITFLLMWKLILLIVLIIVRHFKRQKWN